MYISFKYPDEPLSNISERLNYALDQKDISQDELATLIGIKQATISRISTGKIKKSKHLPDIANILGVSVNWLLTGEAELNTNIDFSENSLRINKNDFMLIRIDEEYIKTSNLKKDTILMLEPTMIPDGVNPDDLRFTIMQDASMQPDIKEGARVTFDASDNNIINGKPYLVRNQEVETIRYLYQQANGCIRLRAKQAEEFPEEFISKSSLENGEFNIKGRVITATNPLY